MDKLLEQVKELEVGDDFFHLHLENGRTLTFEGVEITNHREKQLIKMIEGLQRENENLKISNYAVCDKANYWENKYDEACDKTETYIEWWESTKVEVKQLTDKLKIAEEALEKIQICSTIHLAFDITDKALSRIREENRGPNEKSHNHSNSI